jgi:hypothetical protein
LGGMTVGGGMTMGSVTVRGATVQLHPYLNARI